MVEQLDELYRDVILDHFKQPRHHGPLADADLTAEGSNPLCGDEMALWLKLDGGRIRAAQFSGKGCAISQAAGSMLTERLQGLAISQARVLVEAMKGLMQGQEPPPEVDLGDLESLAGVRKFPVRVKCAALSWNILEQALRDKE